MADRMEIIDEEIQEQVIDELRWDPEVDPTDVGVEVDNGVVTLYGTVKSYPVKFASEKAAHRVRGVRAVANEIRVQLPSDQTRTDTDIATAAASALEWDTTVPHECIAVTVRDGWVTLEGDVDWGHQKEAADKVVRNLTGIKGVTNVIAVMPRKVPPPVIRSRIEESLKRAKLGARPIHVETTDGKVTLSGTVHSWAEREEAEKTAWAAEGVAAVENRITVAA